MLVSPTAISVESLKNPLPVFMISCAGTRLPNTDFGCKRRRVRAPILKDPPPWLKPVLNPTASRQPTAFRYKPATKAWVPRSSPPRFKKFTLQSEEHTSEPSHQI